MHIQIDRNTQTEANNTTLSNVYDYETLYNTAKC